MPEDALDTQDAASRWVCSACGRTSPTLHLSARSERGWGVPCSLNAVWARPRTAADGAWPVHIRWIPDTRWDEDAIETAP